MVVEGGELQQVKDLLSLFEPQLGHFDKSLPVIFILIVKDFGFSLKEISTLIHDEILCGDIKSIKKIVEHKINEINTKINQLAATKRLLEKVKKNILNENIRCCDDIENYLKK